MNSENKKILYGITIIIDIIFVYTYLNYKLTFIDKTFIMVLLISHILFILSLVFYNKKLIDLLHVVVFMSLTFSIFINNKNLLMISMGLLLFIQYAWIFWGKCILLEDNEKSWGFGKELEAFTLILSFAISFKLGSANK
jgi:hypothetical protein